ncbi:HAD family hydrolase [Brevibacillus sp. TJ4]|uniref:HAD family hydrolase n=1 Tax=Brevibacillus sp. TJ4 TaxID=3234853 RepID=UPI003BA23B9F
MKQRWITFDLDGTLMQNPFGKWVFPEVAAAVSGKLGMAYDAISALIAEHERRMSEGRYVEAYDWDEMLERLCEKLGIEKPVDVEDVVHEHNFPPKVYLLEPDIPLVLQRLRACGYSLAAVTNGFFKYQAPVMRTLGLERCFDEVITPEMAGTGKPDPAILRLLPGEVVAHVGDRLDHDVQLANAAGIHSVFVDRTMPERLCSLPPHVRAKDQEMLQLCLAKWKKESRMNDNVEMELPRQLTPDAVICSMQELVALAKEWKEG